MEERSDCVNNLAAVNYQNHGFSHYFIYDKHTEILDYYQIGGFE